MTSTLSEPDFLERGLPLRRNLFVIAALILAAPLWAQTGYLSPRESYDRALTLFGQGHVFTADELQSLETLRGKLIDAGDADLAGDIAVLRLAAITNANRNDANASDATNVTADTQAMNDLAARERDHKAWKLTRDIGLYTFSAATAATLLLAITGSQEEAWLHSSSLSDSHTKDQFNKALEWTAVGSAGLMLVSLFPLLIGQANQ
jgi:hypothetical protein